MPWFLRVVGVAGLVAAFGLAGMLAGPHTDEPGVLVNGPVITPDEDWDAYPTAEVRGTLRLVEGCLLLEDAVVFWPYGARWDPEREAVVFGGDFAGLPDAVVDDYFVGGGGGYGREVGGVLGESGADALNACIAATGASGAVVAHPAGS